MLVVNPQSLVNRVKDIKGLDKVTNIQAINIQLDLATEVVKDWSDTEEIGSSDFTFMLKEFIDLILQREGRWYTHKTDFTPYLSVVER